MVKLISTTGAEIDDGSEKLTRQVFSFFLHCVIAVAVWVGLMVVGYLINPTSVPQVIVSALSVLVPLIAGYIIIRIKPNEMASHIWLAGVIWLLLLSLWIIDLPTGPNACNACSPTEKIVRSLFSTPGPSGLMDDNGPFFGTWPALSLVGYSIGAGLALRRLRRSSEQD